MSSSIGGAAGSSGPVYFTAKPPGLDQNTQKAVDEIDAAIKKLTGKDLNDPNLDREDRAKILASLTPDVHNRVDDLLRLRTRMIVQAPIPDSKLKEVEKRCSLLTNLHAGWKAWTPGPQSTPKEGGPHIAA